LSGPRVMTPLKEPVHGLVSLIDNENVRPDTLPAKAPLPKPTIAAVPLTLEPLWTKERVADTFPKPGMLRVAYQLPFTEPTSQSASPIV
jgi:hypothetical protein